MNSQDAQALNASLQDIAAAIRSSAEVQTNVLKICAQNLDLSLLAVLSMAHMSADFRTVLLRFAQEDAVNPAAADLRKLVRDAISAVQSNSGEKPTLKSV